ncbi:MAG: hypothetical protein WKF77_20725 [Planctomycetaceae bacterium]
MFGAINYFTHQRDGKQDWYRNDVPTPEEGYSTHLIAKEACRVIRDKPADKPLCVSARSPHGPATFLPARPSVNRSMASTGIPR